MHWDGAWGYSFPRFLPDFINSSFNPVELGFSSVALYNVVLVSPLERVDASDRLLHYEKDPVSGAHFLLFREIIFDFIKKFHDFLPVLAWLAVLLIALLPPRWLLGPPRIMRVAMSARRLRCPVVPHTYR